jgi:hypothetical protein
VSVGVGVGVSVGVAVGVGVSVGVDVAVGVGVGVSVGVGVAVGVGVSVGVGVAVGVGVGVSVGVGVAVGVGVSVGVGVGVGVAVGVGVGVGVGSGFTVTTNESLPVRALSLAIRLKVYVPGTANVAVVAGAEASANVTAPGPLTVLHVYVNAPGGFGRPSSVAEPLKLALFGSVIVRLGPALTTGALLTVITTLSLPVSALSLAVSLSV